MKRLISAALALTLISGTAAIAQPARHDAPRQNTARHDNDRHDAKGHDNNRYGDNHYGGNGRGGFQGPRDRDHRDFRGHGNSFGSHGGFGYHPYWRTGERFYGYGRPYVVVNDWNTYHLRRPPYGYHWVRADNDFLLVAVTSGIIADILSNQY